ncbi:MAG: hypothetical protein AAGF49_14525 [Pseudomonadota bacterium]
MGLTHISQDRYSETEAGPFGLDDECFSGAFMTINQAVNMAATFGLAEMGG